MQNYIDSGSNEIAPPAPTPNDGLIAKIQSSNKSEWLTMMAFFAYVISQGISSYQLGVIFKFDVIMAGVYGFGLSICLLAHGFGALQAKNATARFFQYLGLGVWLLAGMFFMFTYAAISRMGINETTTPEMMVNILKKNGIIGDSFIDIGSTIYAISPIIGGFLTVLVFVVAGNSDKKLTAQATSRTLLTNITLMILPAASALALYQYGIKFTGKEPYHAILTAAASAIAILLAEKHLEWELTHRKSKDLFDLVLWALFLMFNVWYDWTVNEAVNLMQSVYSFTEGAESIRLQAAYAAIPKGSWMEWAVLFYGGAPTAILAGYLVVNLATRLINFNAAHKDDQQNNAPNFSSQLGHAILHRINPEFVATPTTLSQPNGLLPQAQFAPTTLTPPMPFASTAAAASGQPDPATLLDRRDSEDLVPPTNTNETPRHSPLPETNDADSGQTATPTRLEVLNAQLKQLRRDNDLLSTAAANAEMSKIKGEIAAINNANNPKA